MLRDLLAHRDLLWLLTVREIRVRYARAALGVAWAIFPPLVMAAVFSVLNFGRLIDATSPFHATPYVVFALVGLVPWAHFATSLQQATPSLVLASSILKKASFPHAVVPLARVLAALLDLGVGVLVVAALLAWNHVPVGASLAAVPLVFALQLAFTAGLALLLSAANMFFRDVNYLFQVAIVLAMFATSVVYPISPSSPLAAEVLRWNPMSSYLDAYRSAVLLRTWPSLAALLPGVVGAVLSLGLGGYVFTRSSPRFAEEV